MRWAVELSEFDMHYEPRGPITCQVYADIMTELSLKGFEPYLNNFYWVLYVNGSSNLQGSGGGVILEGQNEVLIEKAIRFAFKASNNQDEYEALIVGMLLAKELGAHHLLAKNDSLLVTGYEQIAYCIFHQFKR